MRPIRRQHRPPPPQCQQHETGQQRAKGEDQSAFAPVQPPDHRRVQSMRDAADEIDHLAPPDPQRQHRRPIAAKDHPQRAHGPQGQRPGHPQGRHLPQQHKAEPRRHHRRQREHRRCRHRRRRPQAFEHQHEIAGEQRPQHQIAPRCLKRPARNPPGQNRRSADQRPRQGKPRHRQGRR